MRAVLSLAVVMLAMASGCQSGDSRLEPFGKTYYLDGAGNLGFGVAEVPRGLREEGYRGDVEPVLWTTSFNPLIDQLNILGVAKGAGQSLARKIQAYRKQHPTAPVHIIALSAGTGVAVWACESLPQGVSVDNVILLGSSLSCDYDMRAALAHVKGRVYVYHSPNDSVLQAVEVVGTIDRRTGVKSAGQIGLRPRTGGAGQIVNIPWSARFSSLGWAGGHTDTTNIRFVRGELARHIVSRTPTVTPAAAVTP